MFHLLNLLTFKKISKPAKCSTLYWIQKIKFVFYKKNIWIKGIFSKIIEDKKATDGSEKYKMETSNT